ncbi:hypothetical protein [Mycolicibacterium canariasense]|nr:hypothetical protein [Mycolicibacterium canariasense]MCV7210340.1 hypothetical protein [Mycolicibacterium canariasense]
MRENSATLPSIAPPVGADLVGQWEDHIEGQQAYRGICGADRHITDHEATVYPMVVQLADGSIQDDEVSSPGIYVCQGDRDCLPRLNVDQARELAAALLDCVTELDRWVQR